MKRRISFTFEAHKEKDSKVIEAVHRYLDSLYNAEYRDENEEWPYELQAISGWAPPETRAEVTIE